MQQAMFPSKKCLCYSSFSSRCPESHLTLLQGQHCLDVLVKGSKGRTQLLFRAGTGLFGPHILVALQLRRRNSVVFLQQEMKVGSALGWPRRQGRAPVPPGLSSNSETAEALQKFPVSSSLSHWCWHSADVPLSCSQVKPFTWLGISATSAKPSSRPRRRQSTCAGSTPTPRSSTPGKTCCWLPSEYRGQRATGAFGICSWEGGISPQTLLFCGEEMGSRCRKVSSRGDSLHGLKGLLLHGRG